MTDHKPTPKQEARPYSRTAMYVPTDRSAPKSDTQQTVAKVSKLNAVKNIGKLAKVRFYGFVQWWKQPDTKYHWQWRAANLFAVILIITSIAIPVATQLYNSGRYELSAAALGLVGKNNQKLASKLKYNAQTKTYEFNKDAVKAFNPVDQLKAQVGTSPNSDKDKSLYALDIQEDITKGVTYHDVNSQLSFKFVPQFGGLSGKTEQGHLVYPLADNTQAVYTLKNNGLKEDIVVKKATKDTMQFSYTLELPKTLEARQLPDGSGAIGIYSANPSLFGNISYGSDADREKVEKARENGTKDTLVFGIPAPTITASHGDDASKAKARFELKGQQLTVIAEGLTNLKQPFSIDPSVVITSTSDFQTNGNNEGNISFSTAGQVTRDGLSGGTLGAWHFTDNSADRGTSQGAGSGAASGMITNRQKGVAAAYNGYVYAFGGNISTGSGYTDLVERAPINSNGTVGTWVADTPMPSPRETRVAVYNGYMYVVSGGIGGNSNTTDVLYAPISTANGSLGAWTPTTALSTARTSHAVIAYNGYLYVINGCTVATPSSCNLANPAAAVLCAAINPNGSIGTWNNSCGTTNLTGRNGGSAAVYNGFIYFAGGCQTYSIGSCSNLQVNVQYSKINSDGTLGSWVTASSNFTTGSSFTSLMAIKGYLYLTNNWQDIASTMQYAPIQANGDIGSWATTSNINVSKGYFALAGYGNYLYVIGGCISWPAASCTNISNAVEYVSINPAGVARSYATTSSLLLNRSNHATVAYNGYLYVTGGSASGNLKNDVQYAAINADGTVGAWHYTHNSTDDGNTFVAGFTTVRALHATVAYNGYMYIIGGYDTVVTWYSDVQYAPINANGTIGTWAPTASLIVGKGGAGVITYNGYMYLTGGYPSSGVMNDVQYAPINTNGTLGAWHYTHSGTDDGTTFVAGFTTGRWEHQSVVANGYLYVMGGRDTGTVAYKDIQYALLCTGNNSGVGGCSSTAGTVGSWNTNSVDLPTTSVGRGNFAAMVNKGYLYVAGGCGTYPALFNNCTVVVNDTQFAKLNSNGSVATVGGWTATASFTNARKEHTAIFYNDYLYVLAGANVDGSAWYNDVQYAQINNGGSGTTGTWSTQGNTGVPGGLIAGAAYNDYLYITGGCTSNVLTGAMSCSNLGIQGHVRYAQMGSDGTVGSWASAGADFVTARYGHASVAYNGYLYIMGGCSVGSGGDCPGGFQNDVQYALICTGSNNGVGGCGATAGTVGTWNTNPNSFATGRYGLSGVTHNGYMYIMGGCSATASGSCTTFQNDVQYALICTGSNNGVGGCGATPGTVGTWASAGTGFTTGRLYQNAVAYNNYLYVMNGCSAMVSTKACTTFQGDVQVIALNSSNGTLTGSWSSLDGTGFPRYGASSVAYNGYIYLTGGCTAHTGASVNCTSELDTITYAPIASSGYIGRWQTAPNKLPNTRFLHGSVMSRGYMVVLNGITAGSTNIQVADTAPINSIPRKGLYSKLLTFNFGTSFLNITYNGTLANGNSDISYRSSSSATSWTGSTTNASSLTNARCPAPANNRYLQLLVTLDDTQRGTFPDYTTDAANLTDLTLSYEFSRPPNIRLKLGKILQENIGQTDLDICKLTS